MSHNKVIGVHTTDKRDFDGDIIITDPCYVVEDDDDWTNTEYGQYLENIGIEHYMTRNTLYGDWSCTTYNSDTGEEIGEFCADAGMVSVLLLDEVLAYNPNFNYHIEKPWTTTMIKDFKGSVEFVVYQIGGEYSETTEWWNKGDKYVEREVQVIGHGINKITGESINFIGKQTGL